MKPKTKRTSMTDKAQSTIYGENDLKWKTWQRIGLQLSAVFLIIVFLASECAVLLPVE